MKKIILFLITGFIIGCSSDDSVTDKESGLVGTWLRISVIDEDGDEYVDEEDCPHETIISETTVSAVSYFGDDCSSSANSGVSLPYALDGNIMNFELGTEKSTLEILELTSTTLKIKDEDDDDVLSYFISTYTRQ